MQIARFWGGIGIGAGRNFKVFVLCQTHAKVGGSSWLVLSRPWIALSPIIYSLGHMKPSKSPIKLNLSSPIYQTPTAPQHPHPSPSNLYKAERTITPTKSSPSRPLNPSPSKLQNPTEIKQAYQENYQQACCPNCRYLFRVSTWSPRKEEWVERLKNIRSVMVQTEVVEVPSVEVGGIEEIIRGIEAAGKETPEKIRIEEEVVQKPSPQKPLPTGALLHLAQQYSLTQQHLTLFLDFLLQIRHKPDIPAYLKYLDEPLS